MVKFFFNTISHTFEKVNIPTYKEWINSKEVTVPEKDTMPEASLIDSYTQMLSEDYSNYQCTNQEIMIINISNDHKIIFEFYVDENEGIVHILDLNMEDTVPVTDVANDSFFQHIFEERSDNFKKKHWFDYLYFIYGKDGIVSTWKKDKLWFEKHYNLHLKNE